MRTIFMSVFWICFWIGVINGAIIPSDRSVEESTTLSSVETTTAESDANSHVQEHEITTEHETFFMKLASIFLNKEPILGKGLVDKEQEKKQNETKPELKSKINADENEKCTFRKHEHNDEKESTEPSRETRAEIDNTSLQIKNSSANSKELHHHRSDIRANLDNSMEIISIEETDVVPAITQSRHGHRTGTETTEQTVESTSSLKSTENKKETHQKENKSTRNEEDSAKDEQKGNADEITTEGNEDKENHGQSTRSESDFNVDDKVKFKNITGHRNIQEKDATSTKIECDKEKSDKKIHAEKKAKIIVQDGDDECDESGCELSDEFKRWMLYILSRQFYYVPHEFYVPHPYRINNPYYGNYRPYTNLINNMYASAPYRLNSAYSHAESW